MSKRSELEPLIIQEWLQQQPAGQRKESEILAFHGRLQRDSAHLLAFRASADKYELLKTILRDHIER